MTSGKANIDLVLFDIGGVLGSNGWDREQRSAAIDQFGLDPVDFQDRHEETVGALETGHMTLDEYISCTMLTAEGGPSCADVRAFMFAQSVPWPDSIGVARDLANTKRVRMATLNNEGEELNNYRIESFGLRDIFPVFFTSCWLHARKPMHETYGLVLGMTQADPRRTLFADDRRQNLTPAAALGMKTIHFQSAEQLRHELHALGLLS